MIDLPEIPVTVRTLTNDEITRLRTRFPRIPSSPEQCPTCRGKGSFRWWHYEGTEREVAEYRCNCLDQWMLYLLFLNANIGDVYQRLSWQDVVSEPAGVAKVKAYLANYEAYVQAGCGLILYGNKGTGKTLLSLMLLKQLLADGRDGYFTTFIEMIDSYTGGWYDEEQKAWFHRRVKNTEVLVIDDLGKEYQGQSKTDLPRSSLDEVFRHRTAAASPTIITTNKGLTGVHDAYGEHIMSLLRERSTTYEFTGEDYRDISRNRMHDEIERGLTRPVTIA